MTGPPLDYGRDAKSQRWQEVRRWTSRALILAVVLIVSAVVLPIIYERFRLMSCEKPCLSYVAPANQVVYTNDPAETANLLKQGGGYADLKVAGGSGVGFSPPAWDKFQQRYGVIGSWSEAIVFLHERVSKNGVRRLVCITYLGPDRGSYVWTGCIEQSSLLRMGKANTRRFQALISIGRRRQSEP
jgi:hypothetical protein